MLRVRINAALPRTRRPALESQHRFDPDSNHLKTTLAALTWHWHHFRYGYAAEAHSALETDDMPRDAGVNSGGTSQQSLNSNLIRVLETTRSSPQSKPQVQKTIIILCIGTSPSRGWKRLGFSRYGIIYESIHWDCSL